MRDWQRWRAARLAALNVEDGPPALVATYWLDEREHVPRVAGTWLVGDDVVLRLDNGEDVLALRDGEPFGPRIRLDGQTLEVTNRHGRRGVRVFEHARTGSISVGTFEYDPAWVVRGTLTPVADGAQAYVFQHGATQEIEVPGVVSFSLGGRHYHTRPFRDEEGLLLVFADATTGSATKPPCRFLLVEAPEEGGPVELDFNRAYLPPCAFSDQFSCPLPPPGHRLEVAVTAGETWPDEA